MRRPRVVVVLVLIASIALGWEIGGADRTGPRSIEAAEADRLRLHFAEVEREMLARDISDLSPAQRAARTEQIRQLRRYSALGEFPRNSYHPGRRVPYFRDADGTLCAMAFLIAASGRGDLVDAIARTRNYAVVPDLADQPGLSQWLDEHGLTLAEAARIQPSYDGDWPCCTVDDPPLRRAPGTGYMVASAGVSALSGLSIAWTARSADRVAAQRWKGFLGAGVGGANLVLGLSRLGSDGWENQTAAIWNLAIGATAGFLGVRALRARPATAAAVVPARLSLIPVASAVGSAPGIGFAGRFRF
jgi:hypothetical protein